MQEMPITQAETEIANEESGYLYGYLRKKYSNDSVSHLDIILNSLSFALLRMIHLHVRKQDRLMIAKIIFKTLENGIHADDAD